MEFKRWNFKLQLFFLVELDTTIDESKIVSSKKCRQENHNMLEKR